MTGPFKLQKRALRAFKTPSWSGWDLYGSKLKGIFTSENYGNAIRQGFAPFIECKNRVLTNYDYDDVAADDDINRWCAMIGYEMTFYDMRTVYDLWCMLIALCFMPYDIWYLTDDLRYMLWFMMRASTWAFKVLVGSANSRKSPEASFLDFGDFDPCTGGGNLHRCLVVCHSDCTCTLGVSDGIHKRVCILSLKDSNATWRWA